MGAGLDYDSGRKNSIYRASQERCGFDVSEFARFDRPARANFIFDHQQFESAHPLPPPVGGGTVFFMEFSVGARSGLLRKTPCAVKSQSTG